LTVLFTINLSSQKHPLTVDSFSIGCTHTTRLPRKELVASQLLFPPSPVGPRVESDNLSVNYAASDSVSSYAACGDSLSRGWLRGFARAAKRRHWIFPNHNRLHRPRAGGLQLAGAVLLC
jgi:hypothetical protein